MAFEHNRTARALVDNALIDFCKQLDLKDQSNVEAVYEGFGSMGPSGFIDDLTEEELPGFVKTLDWIKSYILWEKGAKGHANANAG